MTVYAQGWYQAAQDRSIFLRWHSTVDGNVLTWSYMVINVRLHAIQRDRAGRMSRNTRPRSTASYVRYARRVAQSWSPADRRREAGYTLVS